MSAKIYPSGAIGDVQFLADALEKARGDVRHRAEAMRVLIAERDSARALLRKVAACGWVPQDLRARIAKELAQ